MTIKIRDWLVLLSGVALILLGGFQLAYNLKNFQVQDFIVAGIILAVFAWLYFMYEYKQDKTLFDEYYSEKLFKSLEYALAITIVMVWIIILIFEKDNMISVNYIYGALRLGVGMWLLYFSFIIMKESSHE